MKYIYKNIKGFTLIELLVSLAILGIILLTISSFFIFNYKIFNKADNQITAQYEAQIGINKLTEGSINAIEIYEDARKVIENKEVRIITFKTKEMQKENGKYKEAYRYIQFIYEIKNGIIKYGEGNSPEHIDAKPYVEHIQSFQITFIHDNNELYKGVNIQITSEVNNIKVELENNIYFRNGPIKKRGTEND
ncbi:prepilin-type N-terminal cleavage/methylation domain-containing protein [Crassaminicella indica]|uniref:Prepilin-type N-terminal cleavage/methylation domain-containing protein n=1 Tax=Crassaminicella indica TaxID=2855394 RepID=A0ABX8RB17_9CLOT|nr:prepilin-type N-terminal cleavage/methylation domain-containing protein [Crassaminicella indica]QXM06001.1 prepilin-type N-terminal cleavage/methylation domain-containing protein [Crassaminicella indica]